MIYEIKTYADDSTNRVIYARVPQYIAAKAEKRDDGFHVTDPIVIQYFGASSLQINPQMQINFQFPIEAATVEEAFANYGGAHAVAEREQRKQVEDAQRRAIIANTAAGPATPILPRRFR